MILKPVYFKTTLYCNCTIRVVHILSAFESFMSDPFKLCHFLKKITSVKIFCKIFMFRGALGPLKIGNFVEFWYFWHTDLIVFFDQKL